MRCFFLEHLRDVHSFVRQSLRQHPEEQHLQSVHRIFRESQYAGSGITKVVADKDRGKDFERVAEQCFLDVGSLLPLVVADNDLDEAVIH